MLKWEAIHSISMSLVSEFLSLMAASYLGVDDFKSQARQKTETKGKGATHKMDNASKVRTFIK